MFKLSEFSTLYSPDGKTEGRIEPRFNNKSALSLIPGLIITIVGFGVTAFCAFRRGSVAYENAEFKTMLELGIMKESEEDEDIMKR